MLLSCVAAPNAIFSAQFLLETPSLLWVSDHDQAAPSPTITMDNNPAKRRKVDHREPRGLAADGSAALDAAAQAGTPRPSTFALQTQELLREVRLDYDKTFAGADALLHRIKSTLEATKPHEPTPVSVPARPARAACH